MTRQLLYPMVFYVIYMWGLAGFTFFSRLSDIRSKKISTKYFKIFQGDIPERLAVIGRHFNHQFELPPIFLIGCLVHMTLKQIDQLTLILAWAFVASRLVHSFIHLGRNYVPHRALVYAVGWFIVAGLWAQLLF